MAKKMDIQAKKEVLKELLDMAMGEMRGKNKQGLEEMRNMKKVSVMAPDEEGLKEGLEKAEDILEGEEGPEMADEDMEEGEEDSDMMKEMLKKKLMQKA